MGVPVPAVKLPKEGAPIPAALGAAMDEAPMYEAKQPLQQDDVQSLDFGSEQLSGIEPSVDGAALAQVEMVAQFRVKHFGWGASEADKSARCNKLANEIVGVYHSLLQ